MHMMRKYPFYVKFTVIMLGMVLCTIILFTLRDILVPLSFALILAILLNPVAMLFEKWRIPRTLAIMMTIGMAMILILGIAWFLFMEIRNLTSELPLFKEKADHLLSRLQHWASTDIGINRKKQNQYLIEIEDGLKPVLAAAMGTFLGTLAMIFLLPVYTFLFMFYKKLIRAFLYELFENAGKKEVSTVLVQTKKAIQHYMYGLILEALVVACLNTLALLILHVKYAILLGVLGALLNVLPFIGGIIAILFPLLITTVTHDGFQTQLWTVIAYLVIQFIDNHFLVPYIVASRVKINALISIVIVLLGGALWGISGMFLSIPFIGVIKIVMDRLPELKAWAMLIGREVPARQKLKYLVRKNLNAEVLDGA
jgi:predicted PurR-regulated permease PerM